MLRPVKNKWKLSVLPNLQFPILPPALSQLNGGVLEVLGQHKTDASDTFDIFVGHLKSRKTSQLVGGAIDEHDHVGFIFLADGKVTGTQYVFQGQHKDDGTIGGSIGVSTGADGVDPTDVGTWSGTGGGNDDGRRRGRK